MRNRQSLTELAELVSKKKTIEDQETKAFFCEHLSEEMMDYVHHTCQKLLSAVDNGTAVRIEIYVILHLCQPRLLFYRCKYSSTVESYINTKMNISPAVFSYYKTNIVFLFLHDKQFRELANKIEQEVEDKLT